MLLLKPCIIYLFIFYYNFLNNLSGIPGVKHVKCQLICAAPHQVEHTYRVAVSKSKNNSLMKHLEILYKILKYFYIYFALNIVSVSYI